MVGESRHDSYTGRSGVSLMSPQLANAGSALYPTLFSLPAVTPQSYGEPSMIPFASGGKGYAHVPRVSNVRQRLKTRAPDRGTPAAAALDQPTGSVMPRSGTPQGRPISAVETDSGLLSSLYESVGKADGWTTFIDALARSYGGGKATFFIGEAATQNGHIQASGQWEPEQITRFNQYYVANNPWMMRVGRISPRRLPGDPIGQVVRSEQVLPRSDLLKTEHYNDFLRPAQVEALVSVKIQGDGSRRVSLNVLFPQATAERDPDTVGRLQRLVPHILRVAQLNRQLGGFETRAVSAEAALNGLGTAMMIVNTARHVVYMNAAAERIIAAGDGPRVVSFVLDAVVPGEGKLLRQLIASALQARRNVTASPGGVMRISRRSGCAPYEVLVQRFRGTTRITRPYRSCKSKYE
jgi:hypothetical protein